MSHPAFLDNDPPHWAARGLAYLLICLFFIAALVSVLLYIPETVSCPFVLVPVQGRDKGAGQTLQAEISVAQSAVGRLKPGQAVKLLYDAFPYQRYGVRYGTLHWISPAASVVDRRSAFLALADVQDQAVSIQGESWPLRPGMGGTAKVVVGRRPLWSYALDPIRQLRENFAAPPGKPGK
jgi:multidrug efflux pump subunit AcrA (membrane-fusion protein)